MYPLSHLLLPFFLAEILVKLGVLTHQSALIAGLLGMLIDVDHLVEYAVNHKPFSLRKAWNAAVKKHHAAERTFLHRAVGVVLMTLILVFVLFINITLFWIVAIGYYSHMLLDYVKMKSRSVLKAKEDGFMIDFPLHELVLDIILLVASAILILV